MCCYNEQPLSKEEQCMSQYDASTEFMHELFETIQMRRRPEDVAAMILPVLHESLSNKESSVLREAAHHAARRWGATSMMEDFDRPVGMQRQVASARQKYLFPSIPSPSASECDDLKQMQKFTASCGETIHKHYGMNDFTHDRLTAAQRRELGMELSRRQYNRLFRFVARLEEKLEKLERNHLRYECVRMGKTKLLTWLPFEEFAKDLPTACFLAYFASRCNLRTRFTICGQTKPFDNICEILLAHCERSDNTNWWAMAYLWPDEKVLSRLDETQKGTLLGMYFDALQRVGELLRDVWNSSNINRETMIVRRGNDSSTWNAAAVAWNRSRDGWIALLYALGADAVLETVCPGKSLVLVAGDLAFLHRAYGKGLHPDTFVWNELPLPWEVMSGEAHCSKEDIRKACHRHSIDPVKSGWTAPRPRMKAVAFKPTPELVYGVEVGSAQLAKVLREAGVFSGKNFKPHKLAE
jgi:hypothetical protein